MRKKTTISAKIQTTENIVKQLNPTMKLLKISDILPQVMNNVIISVIDDHHTQQLPENMTGDKYRTFKKSRGGVFSRDSLAFSRNESCGVYFLFNDSVDRFIGRMIKEEENLAFQTLKLVDGKIVDVNYMKLKDLAPDEKLTRSVRYIIKDDLESENETEETTMVDETDIKNISEVAAASVSLFDE